MDTEHREHEKALPAGYVLSKIMVPSLARPQESALLQKLRKAEMTKDFFIPLLESSPTNEQKTVANILCCLALFDCGQKHAQLAQFYFDTGNSKKGMEHVKESKKFYKAADEKNWRALINTTETNPKFQALSKKPPSRLESLQNEFGFYYESALVVILQFKAIREKYGECHDTKLIDDFLSSYEKAKAVKEEIKLITNGINNIRDNYKNLVKLKIFFLICFLGNDDEIQKKFIESKKEFFEFHNDTEKESKIIKFLLEVENQINPTYEEAVPTLSDDTVSIFFANVFFTHVYAQFKNQDLIIFDPMQLPKNLDTTQYFEFVEKGCIRISIGDLYKFMAHFGNITAQFQFSSNPILNAKIRNALHKAKVLDEHGRIIKDLNETDKEAIEIALNCTGYFKESNFDFQIFLDEVEAKKSQLKKLYDGFPPEKALFLLKESLISLGSRACCKYAAKAIQLLDDALISRDTFRQFELEKNDNSPSEQINHHPLAQKFIETLCPERPIKILQISSPAFVFDENVERHAIFVIFRKEKNDLITVQIINGGLGVGDFHTRINGDRALVKQATATSQELIPYVSMLFELYSHEIFVDQIEFITNPMRSIYSFDGLKFQDGQAWFLTQVTGNCTIFGAQWALNIALGLNEAEHNKLTLDFARGCDLLASRIRGTGPSSAPLGDLPQYELRDETILFPCGYTSKSRQTFKAPGKHRVKEYLPGVPGTNHHVIPQSYLQFLYDELNASDRNLLRRVVGNPPGSPATKKQFAYGNFAMFHGPSVRSDDPEDSQNDPYGGMETQPPIGFPPARWNALRTIGTQLKALLTANPIDFGKQKAAVLATCKTQLSDIVTDGIPTSCFREAAPGTVWELDPNDPTRSKYRLRAAPGSTSSSSATASSSSSNSASSSSSPPVATANSSSSSTSSNSASPPVVTASSSLSGSHSGSASTSSTSQSSSTTISASGNNSSSSSSIATLLSNSMSAAIQSNASSGSNSPSLAVSTYPPQSSSTSTSSHSGHNPSCLPSQSGPSMAALAASSMSAITQSSSSSSSSSSGHKQSSKPDKKSVWKPKPPQPR